MICSRYDVVFAYAWFELLWGPTRYGARIRRLGVRFGQLASLEEPSVKQVYGAIVRREHRYFVGFERLRRKMGARLGLQWPGTRNMPLGDERAWLAAQGILDGVLAQLDGGAS